MKALFSVFLALALVAMTAEGFAGGAQIARECAKPPTGCCDHGASRDTPPVNPACQQCCLVCCATLPVAGVEVSVPLREKTKFPAGHFGCVSRNEKPPVPPPRMG